MNIFYDDADKTKKCYKCFRPIKNCYCKYIKSFESGIKFVILMHPKEAYKQKTGTGRLAHLTLTDSEIIVGVDFTQNAKLNALLNDKRYYSVLLYPAENALDASMPQLKTELKNRTLLVIVLDATWPLAKKMLRISANLHDLPKISFYGDYKSKFIFKKQPNEKCLSSIESIFYLINELQDFGITKKCDAEPLMEIFLRMVNFQLESEQNRIKSGIPNRYKKTQT